MIHEAFFMNKIYDVMEASEMIKKLDVMITPFQLLRTMHLYLPDDYDESNEHYPVIYMYDGHNLFDDKDETYGRICLLLWGWSVITKIKRG